jgi:hypothetical protein
LIDNITTLQYTQYQILLLYSLAAFRRSIRITWPELLWGRFKFLKQTAVTFLTSAPPNPASLVTGDYIGSRDHSSSSPLPSALKNRQTHFFDNMFKLAFLLRTRRLNCPVIDHELEVFSDRLYEFFTLLSFLNLASTFKYLDFYISLSRVMIIGSIQSLGPSIRASGSGPTKPTCGLGPCKVFRQPY